MSTQLYSEVMQQTPVPPGFGIIRLEDGRFYPLFVERWEESELIGLNLIPRSLDEQVGGGVEFLSYETRIEALQWCYLLMEEELCRSVVKWNDLPSCAYPERCAWYYMVIEAITGTSVHVWETGDGIHAVSHPYVCSCQVHWCSLIAHAPTIDEVLEILANQVYANGCERCRDDCFGYVGREMNAAHIGEQRT